MSLIASILLLIGLGLTLLGYVAFVIAAFRRSILWGLAVMFLPPFAPLVFLLLHWQRARNAAHLILWGWAFIAIGRLAFNATMPWPFGQ